MRIEELEKKAGNLLLISKKTLEKFEPTINNLNGNLTYWRENKDLVMLKSGLYVLKSRYEKEINKDKYLEFIACQLIQPSYLSLEYVMAKYQLLTEAVNSFTSVTIKKTSSILNDLGAFRYYSISQALFTGYKVKYFYGAPIWEATKEKAIFDFLYLKFLRNQPINKKVIDDLRINWDEVSRVELDSVKKYSELTNSKKIASAIDLVDVMYFK